MLEMRNTCETCGTGLDSDAEDAFICSYECTFCVDCTEGQHKFTCPNCGGKLVQRPPRTKA